MHHLTRDPRPDSAALIGLGINTPTVIGVGLAVLAGILVAHRAWSGGQVLLAVGSVISVFTIFASRGFRNSWWLVVVLTAIALGFDASPEGEQSALAVPDPDDAEFSLAET